MQPLIRSRFYFDDATSTHLGCKLLWRRITNSRRPCDGGGGSAGITTSTRYSLPPAIAACATTAGAALAEVSPAAHTALTNGLQTFATTISYATEIEGSFVFWLVDAYGEVIYVEGVPITPGCGARRVAVTFDPAILNTDTFYLLLLGIGAPRLVAYHRQGGAWLRIREPAPDASLSCFS